MNRWKLAGEEQNADHRWFLVEISGDLVPFGEGVKYLNPLDSTGVRWMMIFGKIELNNIQWSPTASVGDGRVGFHWRTVENDILEVWVQQDPVKFTGIHRWWPALPAPRMLL
ncbi:hypothetical protein C8J57DRAFT_1225840 [Mycena rebaudengoi]|nr:hypothetical protein C8J57DRAFT_1225840 [Mycena rebaudengoi]